MQQVLPAGEKQNVVLKRNFPNHKEGLAFYFDFTEIKEYFIERRK